VAEIYIIVEAESAAAARDLAEEQLADIDIGLCHQCSNKMQLCDPVHVCTVVDGPSEK
jgi:hypothetical protein